MQYESSVLTTFELQLHIRAVPLMSRKVERKKLYIVQNAVNGTMAGIAARHMKKAWDALTKFCSLWSLGAGMQSHMWFNPAVFQCLVLLQRSDGFESLKKERTLFEARLPH